jgi:hypothetical protein
MRQQTVSIPHTIRFVFEWTNRCALHKGGGCLRIAGGMELIGACPTFSKAFYVFRAPSGIASTPIQRDSLDSTPSKQRQLRSF